MPSGANASWCPASTQGFSLTPQSARGTLEGGNATGVHDCGSSQYVHYEQKTPSDSQLHVIGVYQGVAAADGTRSLQVRVTRPGSSVLVLSSYKAATWTVQVAAGASVERIIVNGYEAQGVSAPAGVPIEIHSYKQTKSAVGDFAYDWPAYETSQLVNASEDLTARELTSFRGCYEAASFEVGAPGKLKPANKVSTNSEPLLPKGCESLASESTYCMTLNGNTPTVVGLDSGRTCAGVPIQFSELYDVSSLAWQGSYLYGCIYDRGLARFSLVDGSVDIAPIACQAVSAHRNGLAALLDYDGHDTNALDTVVQFDSFGAAARRVNSCALDNKPYASRMAVQGDQGFFAWHSTHELSTFALNSNDSPRTITLAGYDGWIMGLDATVDGRLIVLGSGSGASTNQLLFFNGTTGAALGTKPLSFYANGLVCMKGSGTATP